MKPNHIAETKVAAGKTPLMPLFFIGHGNPMNALADNAFTRSLGEMRKSLAVDPVAILVISAHWLTRGTQVMTLEHPATIHDFGGFPPKLYEIEYDAPGSPELAAETIGLVTKTRVTANTDWGLDHGAWTVLLHMFPEASVPVYQLSIDFSKSPEYHYNLATELRALRCKGALIIGSGNIVHNLQQVNFRDFAIPFDWALEFDTWVKEKLEARDMDALIHYQRAGTVANLSVPTYDHYLPMLYTLGLAGEKEELVHTFEGIQNASIGMRSFRIG